MTKEPLAVLSSLNDHNYQLSNPQRLRARVPQHGGIHTSRKASWRRFLSPAKIIELLYPEIVHGVQAVRVPYHCSFNCSEPEAGASQEQVLQEQASVGSRVTAPER